MTTGAFWAAASERAVKTAAQAAVALIGTGAVGITSLDWVQIASIAATAAVVSILTSLASDRLGSQPGPSLVNEHLTPPPLPEPVAEEAPLLSEFYASAAPVGDVGVAEPAGQPTPPRPLVIPDDALARRGA